MTCQQKGGAGPPLQAVLNVQTMIKCAEKRVIAVMDRIPDCNQKPSIGMIQVRKDFLGNIVKRVDGVELHLKRAINIIDCFLPIDSEIAAKSIFRSPNMRMAFARLLIAPSMTLLSLKVPPSVDRFAHWHLMPK